MILFKRRLAYSMLSCFILSNCAGTTPSEFRDTKPVLKIENFFSGKTFAWGLFEDRFGNVKKQFSVVIDGKWSKNQLTLDEKFLYDDGKRERRIWYIQKLDEHTYEGQADDVHGTAQGKSYGNAFHWQYEMDLKVGNVPVRVHFDDWMFLQEGNVLINRAKVTKWGVNVGEVSLFFSKRH